MSYSRWSNSYWYTYWVLVDTNKKEEELFDVCGIKMFTYKQLTEDKAKCLKKIKMNAKSAYTKIEFEDNHQPIPEEMAELSHLMDIFIKDVNKAYKT